MRQRGFSMIEIVVTIAVLALLLFAAMPGLGTWLDNTRIRNVADSLQNGLQLARGEAVRRNQNVSFRVTGQVRISDTVSSGPSGVATGRQELPLPAAPVGALIGRVGNSAPFVIGDNERPIRMNNAGRLMLAVNDDQLLDNSGEFRVVVQ